jgi:hypothetical protein
LIYTTYMSSRSAAVARLVVIDLFGSLIWFPVWWYTVGLQGVVAGSIARLRYRSKSYGLMVWIKNFFVPMYGQYDLVGKLVSVFMRFVVLVGRVLALAVEAVAYAVGIVVWVVAPVAFLALAVSSFIQGAVNGQTNVNA